ncbi:hypothetical protein A3K24_02900 [candidate division Kazan bacterium RIFCSPHIGHO2_01_FULL_44_14]|uniref:Uncharacterized protein n=1 Tax=candidate division Kazan bacterium RIFCSPLOWO2_01_FULL_45_19 TaxID=1798538 RepID=A0A1F4NQL0_UNCK3|nr:hypothetical protein [uncultured bacterium]OGB73754.1 MAG: hypothetical protein A3K51_02900 [candidate division Kazan bacterium RIFCSPLOWO2_01_FULL_45_19]OGB77999.1 MAG: hypothetical protein A3K24_02900 [candidate division Kazan bacterium RIFCSPHIGHO2_01_FULL_44_14]
MPNNQGQQTNPVDSIDYEAIVEKYPWIVARDQKTIISPDADGILCGLLMSHYYGWEIVGYYDGKALALKQGLSMQECIFLDIEIFRAGVRSVGHHIIELAHHAPPNNWLTFKPQLDGCINPNMIRGVDYWNSHYHFKYPMATIHLLVGILNANSAISIPQSALVPLLHADGLANILISRYTDNLLSWMKYLGINLEEHPLHWLFFHNMRIVDLMQELANFYSGIGTGRQGRIDKISISDSKGNITLSPDGTVYKFSDELVTKATGFLDYLADKTQWEFKSDAWQFNNLSVYSFSKGVAKPTQSAYAGVIGQNPLSLAITSTDGIQYTVEGPDNAP